MKRSNKRRSLGCRAGLRCLSRSTSSPSPLQAPLRGRWRAPFTSASCGEKRALGDPELQSVASTLCVLFCRGSTVTVASPPSLPRDVLWLGPFDVTGLIFFRSSREIRGWNGESRGDQTTLCTESPVTKFCFVFYVWEMESWGLLIIFFWSSTSNSWVTRRVTR